MIKKIGIVIGWVIAGLILLALMGYAAEYPIDGRVSTALFILLMLVGYQHNRIGTLERRIERLEGAVGDHHRFHNHRTDY